MRHELTSLAFKEGMERSILFLGYRFDIPEILKASDIFVLSSNHEALGLSILEAMAAGVPVVATAVDGVVEIISSGDNGLLVPANDEKAMAEAILELIRNRDYARCLAERGLETVTSRFSLKAMADAHEELYLNLLNKSH